MDIQSIIQVYQVRLRALALVQRSGRAADTPLGDEVLGGMEGVMAVIVVWLESA